MPAVSQGDLLSEGVPQGEVRRRVAHPGRGGVVGRVTVATLAHRANPAAADGVFRVRAPV